MYPELERPEIKFSNPLLRKAVDEAYQESLRILEGVETEKLTAVLTSRRRVNRVMDGTFYVSCPRTSRHGLLYRVPDIQYEVASFAGLDLDQEEIIDSFRVVTELETAFYSVAEAKARLLPFEDKMITADIDELTSIAESCVERAVWTWWFPRDGHAPELVASLNRCVLGFLYHFPYIARRIAVGSPPIVSFESVWGNKWEEILNPLILKQKALPGEDLANNALSRWYERVNNLRIWQVFHFIKRLDPRFRLALLDRFGYLDPRLPKEEKAQKYGTSRPTLDRDFVRGIGEVLEMIAKEGVAGVNCPPDEVASLITEAYAPAFFRIGEKVAKYNSSRMILLEYRNNGSFKGKLTDMERRVFGLATATQGNTFLYPGQVIAEKTGLRLHRVEEILASLAKIAESNESRVVAENGRLIRRDDTHCRLIKLRPLLPPEMLAGLSLRQKQVLEAITTPNEEGRYKKPRDLPRTRNERKLLKRLWQVIQEAGWVFVWKDRIERALDEDRESFNESEVKIMNHLLDWMRDGVPLRLKGGKGIAWTRICKELNQPVCRGYKLRDKLQSLL